MKWKNHTLRIALIIFSIITSSLAVVPDTAVAAGQPGVKKLAAIESIVSTGDGSATELIIKLTSPVTYTSYKTISPLRLVIDLSQVTSENISSPVIVNNGNFKTVTVSRFDTDAGVLTRVEIGLAEDGEAVISAQPNNRGELRISFPALAAIVSSAATKDLADNSPVSFEPLSTALDPAPAAGKGAVYRTLSSISVNNNVITLALDGLISDFKTFRLNKPERYVVDLMNVRSGMASRLFPLNASGVASARLGLYPDKLRVVFDAVNGSFPEATAAKTEAGVVITLDVKSVDENANTKLTAARAEKTPMPAAIKAEVKPEAVNQAISDKQTLKDTNKTKQAPGKSTIEMIDFQVVNGISRISIKVNGDIDVAYPVKTPGYVTLTIKNAFLPKNLQRSLETRFFVSPVLRVTPLSIKTNKSTDTKIRIAIRVAAPFEFRREGDMLYVDFKHPYGLTADKLAIETTDQKTMAAPRKTAVRDEEVSSVLSPISELSTRPSESYRDYKGRKVTLEFADADVRKIFQLLAEVSNKNFVLGDEVTGAISLKLVNVPWDQALDIILDTKGLDKREDGNIILIKGKGKFKSQAEEDLEIKKTQLKNEPLFTEYFPVNYSKSGNLKPQIESLITANTGKVSEDERTNTLIVTAIKSDIDRIKTYLARMDVPERQVMIEARIVEASSTFTQNLGVSWGVHYRDGSASFLGINTLDNSFGGLTTPSVTSGQSGAPGTNMGISFGRLASNIQLDMRLNAAASAGLVKIVSTPKIATLNNKTAKITQGQSIPYQNTTATTGATTQFVQAVLSLEVKPHINANGTIGMEIKATNNSAGTGNPPPINTKEATTEMLLKDGETTVIGGIYKEDETQSDDGVPFLMDIPFLGRLFKSSETRKIKSELLIFITPRILN
ncbi:MAG: type IV pilus secretin PilQ [Desulfuromonadaceae bacterium]|nr:type IV pilus secretin PilQ [Desulfuromonadaceae bacterium]